MTKKLSIFILDDDAKFSQECVDELLKLDILSDFAIDSFYKKPKPEENAEEMQNDIQILVNRQMAFRKGDDEPKDVVKFDSADIMIIDYDLRNPHSSLIGETIAYLCRCFSKCGIIVGMNRFGKNTFDLTLKYQESNCDVNIGESNLGNIGLWTDDSSGFRPWSWPSLIQLQKAFHERVNLVKKNINQKVSDLLGLDDLILRTPKSISELIGKSPRDATVYDFLVESRIGLDQKDRIPKREFSERDLSVMSRFAAARLWIWLEQILLPCQDVLVDAPHLAWNYPSLLSGDISKIESWNSITRFKVYDKIGIKHDRIGFALHKKPIWLSRPVWFWRAIENKTDILEVDAPWKREYVAFSFCEDTSRFHPGSECHEFAAELDSSYISRYVLMDLKFGMDYQPSVRLILPAREG